MSGSVSSVLLDTSAWIAYFSREGHQALKEDVREALASGCVYTCAVVKTELLVGARDPKAFDKLDSLLRALPEAPVDALCWQKAAQTGFALRRKGRSIPLPDLLIAEACRRLSLELWHLDMHYDQIAKLLRIRQRHYGDEGQ
jgi:tRNA(fMet)-specific endonuclease VapC